MTRAPDDTRLPEKLQAAWDEFEEVAGNWHICAKDPHLRDDERDPDSCLPCAVVRAILDALDEASRRFVHCPRCYGIDEDCGRQEMKP